MSAEEWISSYTTAPSDTVGPMTVRPSARRAEMSASRPERSRYQRPCVVVRSGRLTSIVIICETSGPGSGLGRRVAREQVEELETRGREAARDRDEDPRVEDLGELAVLAQRDAQGGALEDDRRHGLDRHDGGRPAVGRHDGRPP